MDQSPSPTRVASARRPRSRTRLMITTLSGLAAVLVMPTALAPVASATLLPPNPAAPAVVPVSTPVIATVAELPVSVIVTMLAATVLASAATTLGTLSLVRRRDRRLPAAGPAQGILPGTGVYRPLARPRSSCRSRLSHQKSQPGRATSWSVTPPGENKAEPGAAIRALAQGRQGDGGDGEAGAGQVRADRGQGAGPVVHDERGTPDGVADPHGQVEAGQGPVGAGGEGRRAGQREGEQAAGPQRAVDAGEHGGALGGLEVAERAEADREVEGAGEGQIPGVGPDPPGVRVGAAGPGQHAGAEGDAGWRAAAHRGQR